MKDIPPFHEGERLLQNRTGEQEEALGKAGFIKNRLTSNGARFIAEQRVLNIAISDNDGRVWSFIVIGDPGYVSPVSSTQLSINLSGTTITKKFSEIIGDCENPQPIGMVFIDLSRARRLRVNGNITQISNNCISVAIEQTCPNCPKYIQKRILTSRLPGYTATQQQSGTELNSEVAGIIRSADTFFTASRHPSGAHDASHRGGQPGFISVEKNRLTIPDYFGNSMFMTLGNFIEEPAGGLSVVDFEAGLQLNMTGRATIDLTNPDPHDGRAGRFWTFDVGAWIIESFQPNPGWSLAGYSRFNPEIDPDSSS